MRIAIAALLFDDTTRIGSHRARSFASELAALGNEVTVFTPGDRDDASSPFEGVNVVRLGSYDVRSWPRTGIRGLQHQSAVAVTISPTIVPLMVLRRRSSPRAHDHIQHLTQQRASSVLRIDELLSAQAWTKSAQEQIEAVYAPSAFDVVFSTFDDLGRAMRASGVARKWIADFRDAAVAEVFLGPLRFYLAGQQSRTVLDADHVTAVSEGVKTSLLAQRKTQSLGEKITVITNGFTTRVPAPPPPPSDPAPLTLAYTGAIYGRRMRALKTLFSAIGRVLSSGREVEFTYAGRNSAEVEDAARQAGIADQVKVLGSVSFEQSLQIQAADDALVVLTWNTPEEKGILSGKFLEYLGADRPILVIVTGDEPDSELGRLTREMHVGACFEETQGSADEVALEHWLLGAADQRAAGKPLTFEPDRRAVDEYNYRELSKRLLSLMSRIVTE